MIVASIFVAVSFGAVIVAIWFYACVTIGHALAQYATGLQEL